MKVFFAADHAGFKLKERLKKYAASLGYETVDAGAFAYDSDDDYPDFVVPAVRAAVATRGKAVVLGGSGLGECIAANKVKGARAATCFDLYTAKMSRLDNDANVLSLGGRTSVAKRGVAEKILKTWLETKFSNAARHKRRIAMLAKLESDK
jgi:ribose 5-phosphate isomerase B